MPLSRPSSETVLRYFVVPREQPSIWAPREFFFILRQQPIALAITQHPSNPLQLPLSLTLFSLPLALHLPLSFSSYTAIIPGPTTSALHSPHSICLQSPEAPPSCPADPQPRMQRQQTTSSSSGPMFRCNASCVVQSII